jgi:XTP/dITP diphosphohydrolase
LPRLRPEALRLVLSTRNGHKLRELSALMHPFELDPLPAGIELPPETGTTFAENALKKARVAAAETGRRAIADDSGIEAAALGGAPGVWSARYAGECATDEENLAKLLDEVPDDGDRRVAYVCALAYVEPGGREELVHGRCEGRLAAEPRGEGGFGYDPAFIPDDYPDDERTMAELTPEEKDAISHRGRAARALVQKLVAAEEAARPAGPLEALLGGRKDRRRRRPAPGLRRSGRRE